MVYAAHRALGGAFFVTIATLAADPVTDYTSDFLHVIFL